MFHFASAFAICIFLFFCGVPAYVFLLPDRFKTGSLRVFLPPFLGMASISLTISYFIPFAKSLLFLKAIAVALFIVGGALFILEFYRHSRACGGVFGKVFWERAREDFKTAGTETVAGIFVLLFSVSFGVYGGNISTGLINGVDAAGYGAAARHLLEWQGRENLLERVERQTLTSDEESSKELIDRSLNLQDTIAGEFLLKAYRWSYPAELAVLTSLLGEDSVYRLNFVILALSFAALFALTAYLSREFKTRASVATLIGLCCALNCNLLHIAIEGQYAQVVGEPSLIFLLILLSQLRELPKSIFESRKEIIFSGFLVAATMPLYNELVFTFGIILVLSLFFDLVFFVRVWRSYLAIILSVALGLTVAWPITMSWTVFLSRHLVHIAVGGTPQAHWATPPELLGFLNLNEQILPLDSPRDGFQYFTIAFLCALFIAPVINLVRRLPRVKLALLLAPVTFILVVFVKTRWVEGIHSYQYMKAYTYFLPLLLSVLLSLLWRADQFGPLARKYLRTLAMLAFLLTLIATASYSVTARLQMDWIREPWLDLSERPSFFSGRLYIIESEESWSEPHYVMSRPADLMPYFMAGLGEVEWLNARSPKILAGHGADRVSVLIVKDQRKKSNWTIDLPGWRMVTQNESFAVIETPSRGSDIIPPGQTSDAAEAKKVMQGILSTLAIHLQSANSNF